MDIKTIRFTFAHIAVGSGMCNALLSMESESSQKGSLDIVHRQNSLGR